MVRRALGVIQHYDGTYRDEKKRITPKHRLMLKENLVLHGADKQPILVAGLDKNGHVAVNWRVVKWLFKMLIDNKIKVLTADPWVGMHRCEENNSIHTAAVIAIFRMIAHYAEMAIGLVHHTRKLGLNQVEITLEDARGSGAFMGALRMGRAMVRMSKKIAEDHSLIGQERRYFQISNAKANFSPPPAEGDWYQLVSVGIGNATEDRPEDWVGVIENYKLAKAGDGLAYGDVMRTLDMIEKGTDAGGKWKESPLAKHEWVGYIVGKSLSKDPETETSYIKNLIKVWVSKDYLEIISEHDPKARKPRNVVVVKTRPKPKHFGETADRDDDDYDPADSLL
jgi:hypothetical protein